MASHGGGVTRRGGQGCFLTQVTAGLGCAGMRVSAELYKLLVYDTSGFSLSHRDMEKTEGLFGTLVAVLPASHRGGELIVCHGDREVTLDMCRAESSELSFAAFYADCEQEVRPITEGNRVSMHRWRCITWGWRRDPWHPRALRRLQRSHQPE